MLRAHSCPDGNRDVIWISENAAQGSTDNTCRLAATPVASRSTCRYRSPNRRRRAIGEYPGERCGNGTLPGPIYPAQRLWLPSSQRKSLAHATSKAALRETARNKDKGAEQRTPDSGPHPLRGLVLKDGCGVIWSGRRDSNPRPPAPQADALPGCATPRPNAHDNRSMIERLPRAKRLL